MKVSLGVKTVAGKQQPECLIDASSWFVRVEHRRGARPCLILRLTFSSDVWTKRVKGEVNPWGSATEKIALHVIMDAFASQRKPGRKARMKEGKQNNYTR